MDKKSFIFALYTNNLLGKSIATICDVISQNTNLSEKQIKTYLYELQNDGKLAIKNDIVNSTKFAKNYFKESSLKSSLVLGVIKTDNKGYYYFKPSIEEMPEIPLVASTVVKQSVNNRCCCEIKDGKTAVIKQVFGEVDDPIVENTAIAYKYGFEKHFKQDVLDEVSSIPQIVLKEDFVGRSDLREIPFLTVDPSTAKDKDDAIYAEKTDFGYRVKVAIADVGHYVKKDSKIDLEAFNRGTSCYLGSGVYPMLPPELSNGICSLNEKLDRLVVVSTIDIDKKGKILDYKFERAVINVKNGFSYENAEKVYLGQDGLDKKFVNAKEITDICYDVSDVLEAKLNRRGNLEFLNYEPVFKFNKEKNRVEDVESTGKEKSHKVIEMFMILANEAASKFFKDNNLEGIYRIHLKPKLEKLTEANEILKSYGIKQPLVATSKDYQLILNKLRNLDSKEYFFDVVQKTLSKARYSPQNLGHFGLASTGYTHFTSPIRRYSDLIAHRIICEYLEMGKAIYDYYDLEKMSSHLNEQEKKAVKAERESDKFLCCMWAKNHLEEVFNGYITKVELSRVYVRYKGVVVEVPTTMLKNGQKANYVLGNDLQSLTDKKTGKTYRVGDYVDFKISHVNEVSHTIYASTDFELKKDKTTKKPKAKNIDEMFL